ncbi:MAG: hypothetical protein QW112_03570 [Candidatus Micrarchaeia archaeon]
MKHDTTECKGGKTQEAQLQNVTPAKDNLSIFTIVIICATLIAGIVFGYFLGINLLPQSNRPGISNITAKITEYINTNFLDNWNMTINITNVTDMGDIYMMNYSLFNKNNMSEVSRGSIFITKDGEYWVDIMYNLSAPFPKAPETPSNNQKKQETPKNLSKTERPTVELYIFSYCPAGTAALDAYGRVGKILSNFSDMKVKFFSDMHGPHELQQNKIQECIQVKDPAKYWDYVLSYYTKVYSVCARSGVDCDWNESIKLMQSVNINSDEIISCVEELGDILYSNDINDARKYALQYSPSLILNNVSYDADFDRSPDGIKSLICSAFLTPPSACNQDVGSVAVSSGSCS